jgi:lysine 2,3-aminomutase
MDLIGRDVPQVVKLKFQVPQKDRYQQMLEYLRMTPSMRDVVVSGGDTNLPIGPLDSFVSAVMDLPNIRDIRNVMCEIKISI